MIQQTNSPCPICNEPAGKAWHEDQFAYEGGLYSYTVFRCPQCGLNWVEPFPSQEAIRALYPSSYRANQGTDNTVFQQYNATKLAISQARYDRSLLSRAGVSLLELLMGKTVPMTSGLPLQLPKSAHLLDVGCGAGGWLLAMKQIGYCNLTGQDIDDSCRQRLEQQGVSFLHGILQTFASSFEGSFDLIRMEHVLEHLLEPIFEMKLLRSMLRPGGYIVLTVPHIQSLSFQYAGLKWHALELPRHMFHYTLPALKYLARNTGFELVKVQHLPVWSQMALSLVNMSSSSRTRIVLQHPLIAISAGPVWAATVRTLRRGDFICVVMRAQETFPTD